MGILRNEIVKHKKLFSVVHVLYTPIRIIKETYRLNVIGKNLIMQISDKPMFSKHIWAFGEPIHNNMGDQAQKYCINTWLSKHYPDYNIQYFVTEIGLSHCFVKWLKENIKREDIIIFQSGYCTQEKHMDHDMHLYLVKGFPDNRIIFFPQTVNLITNYGKIKAAKIFNNHQRLLFLARDKVSYSTAKALFSNVNVECYPDIVTTLIGSYHSDIKKRGILVCVRNDSEKKYTTEEISKLEDRLMRITEHVVEMDTDSKYDLDYIKSHTREALKEMIDTFAQYRVVITDRYHGTIFSLIANTPVIVIKTLDHKVSTGVDWFDSIFDNHSVQYAESLNDAFIKAKDLISNPVEISNGNYFLDYYDGLESKINDI